jgi:hypothetical protein
MIEALLYIFANNEGALREQVAQAENAQTRAIIEADSAAGGRVDVAYCAPIKFHLFNDAVFFECRMQFLPGPFSTSSSNAVSRV